MDKNKFKDKMGRWITSGLFKETSQSNAYVVYTLDEARKYYLECNDPTGYIFATTFLEGYKHFLALKESPTLVHHITQWEDELEVKIRSQAIQNIHTTSKGVNGYQASKYLVEAGWLKNKVGRPSAAQIKKESKMRSTIYDEFQLEVVK